MSNNLNLSQVANNQASKEVTINSALLQIDAATTEHVSISVASANGDITAAQLTRNVHFYITAATVVGRIVTVDTPTKRLIAVEADATNTQSVDLVCGTTHITIKPGSCFIVYLDGTANGAKAINAPGALASLSDVNVSTLPDKAVLRYDLASGKWIASLWAVTSQAASYTFVLADSNSTVECTSAGAATFTIPLNASVAFSVGTEIECVQYGAGLLTIAGAGGVTLHGISLVTTTQYQRLLLRKVATDEWNVAIIGSAAGGGGGGATTLATLTDVNVTEGAGIDGKYLKWDNATSKWIAATVSGGGGGGAGTAPLYELGPFAPPLAAWFTVAAAAGLTTTLTDVSMQGLSMLSTGATGNDQHAIATIPVSGLPTDWKVTARLIPKAKSGNSPGVGIWVYNSSNGQMYGIEAENAGTGGIIHVRRNSGLGTFNNNDASFNVTDLPTWFQLEKVGTALFLRYSWDGIDFFNGVSTTTTYASGFDKIGIGGAVRGDSGVVTDRGGFLCTYYDDPNHPASTHTVTPGGAAAVSQPVIVQTVSYSPRNNAVTTHSVTIAAPTAGNLLIAMYNGRGTTEGTAPGNYRLSADGWSEQEYGMYDTFEESGLLMRVADGTEGTINFLAGSADWLNVTVIELSGAGECLSKVGWGHTFTAKQYGGIVSSDRPCQAFAWFQVDNTLDVTSVPADWTIIKKFTADGGNHNGVMLRYTGTALETVGPKQPVVTWNSSPVFRPTWAWLVVKGR